MIAEGRWFIRDLGEFDLAVEDVLRQAALLRGSSEGTLQVARVDGALRGFVSLRSPPFRRTRHVVKLEIAVDAASRGQGVGRALLDAAIGWAERSEVVEKIGLSVFADNERALSLYRSVGFVEEGRRPREYRMEDGTYRDDVLLYRFV